ncbi:hypothetical protein AB45_4984 [Escherichia coli 3-105-05_S1_C2]|nr:hypothetical protein AB45_4984 [Escherichia coli 3-105-05_S1_C2]
MRFTFYQCGQNFSLSQTIFMTHLHDMAFLSVKLNDGMKRFMKLFYGQEIIFVSLAGTGLPLL